MLSLLVLCGGADALSAAPPAGDPPLQAPDQPATPRTLETIRITGTHLRDIDLETQHPLLVLTREDLLRTGLTDVAWIIQNLVITGQTQNRNINNGNDGRELVNLRSLGFNRTLVLVNGQRWVSGLDGAVDLSAIPLSLVERIEVLKDGASAIYGSDAIAGVVNIIARRDFVGAAAGTYFGETDHADGQRREFDFSYGAGGERWNASFGVDYAKDDPVMAGARAISSVPVANLPLGALGTGAAYLSFRYRGPWTLIRWRPGTAPGDFRPFDFATDFNFNYAPYNYLQTPLAHESVFVQGHYEFAPTLKLVGDVLFNRRESAQQLAPPQLAFGSFCCAGTPAGFDLSADSVYNPLGVPVTRVTRRIVENPPRRWEQSVDTTRVHLGLDGAFDLAGRSVDWGADVLAMQARQRERIGPYQDNAKLALAVGPSFLDTDGAARCGTPADPIAGCVPLNVLGPPGSVTPAMLDYVDVQASNRMRSETRDATLHATTALLELPAGPLNVAVGAEYRHEGGRDDPDALLANDMANGGGTNYRPTSGAYSVREAFAEVEIPLLAERLFARQLGIDVATRWSDYSRFGSTINSQFALRWKPVGDLLLRAGYIEGFRAPSVWDLFQGELATFDAFQDPCASTSHPASATAARCALLGVPPDVVDWGGSSVTYGGNPALRPETSRTRTVGMVYSPKWAPGLTASLDWYRIRIRNAIGERTTQAILDACYELGDNGACVLVTRDPVDGTLSHVDASQQNIPGGLETEGYDLVLDWRRDTRFGQFGLRWDSAWVSYFGAMGQPAPGTLLPDGSPAVGNTVGRNMQPGGFYGVVWRLRSVLGLAWQRGAWNASMDARYFSPITETCQAVFDVADVVGDPALRNLCSDPGHLRTGQPDPLNHVGAVTYVDLQAGWIAPWKGRFSVGVRNAFDRDPPVAYSAYANSFFPDYDIPGRFFWASYRQRF